MTVLTADTRTIDPGTSTLIRRGAMGGIAGGLVIAAVGMVLDAGLGVGFWALPNALFGTVTGLVTRTLES